MAKERKEHIVFFPNESTVECHDGFNPYHVGYFRWLAGEIGLDKAGRLYDGMSMEKRDFIASLDTDAINYLSVRWTVDEMRRRLAGDATACSKGGKHRKISRDDYPIDYDDRDYDVFYGPKDNATYARWLYNRKGAHAVAKHFHITTDTAYMLGESCIPGSTKVDGITEDAIAEMENSVIERRILLEQNLINAINFHKNGSRRLKIRMNRMAHIPAVYVLRQLLEAEEYSIKAKNCPFDYVDYNYDKKSECIRNAISRLPDTGWRYWWQDDMDGGMAYIFYVQLPDGAQVSWHGADISDMNGVNKDNTIPWDGQLASTIPKLVNFIQKLCPSICGDKFNRTACEHEITVGLALFDAEASV